MVKNRNADAQLQSSSSEEDDNDDDEWTSPFATRRFLPCAAGVIMPFAMVLDIPSLATPWLSVTTDQSSQTLQKPPLLFALLGLSLATSIAGVASFVARLWDRSVHGTTQLTMALFAFHNILNIAAVCWFALHYPQSASQDWTEGFWTTIACTVLSVIMLLMLTVDYIAIIRSGQSTSGVTGRQRTLALASIVFAFHIGIGAVMYQFIENWTFVDALFFVFSSITTTGFGSTPQSTIGRCIAVVYVTFGIILFAVNINAIRQVVLEDLQQVYERRLALKRIKRARKRALAEARAAILKNSENNQSSNSDAVARSTAIQYARATENAIQDFNRSLTIHSTKSADDDRQVTMMFPHLPLTETSTISTYTDALDAAAAERASFRFKLFLSALLFVVFWLLGGAVFSALEPTWSYPAGLYFCWNSMAGIGYGDYTPANPLSKSMFCFWILLGYVCLAFFGSMIGEAVSRALSGGKGVEQRRKVIELEEEEKDRRNAQEEDLERGRILS